MAKVRKRFRALLAWRQEIPEIFGTGELLYRSDRQW
jgi:hypothetical protein